MKLKKLLKMISSNSTIRVGTDTGSGWVNCGKKSRLFIKDKLLNKNVIQIKQNEKCIDIVVEGDFHGYYEK